MIHTFLQLRDAPHISYFVQSKKNCEQAMLSTEHCLFAIFYRLEESPHISYIFFTTEGTCESSGSMYFLQSFLSLSSAIRRSSSGSLRRSSNRTAWTWGRTASFSGCARTAILLGDRGRITICRHSGQWRWGFSPSKRRRFIMRTDIHQSIRHRR